MFRIVALISLCIFSYLPLLSLPLMEDDYPNISQSIEYGRVSNVGMLASDATFRLRSTSYWVMHAVWELFGVEALPSHTVSLLLHIVATLLVYLLAQHFVAGTAGAFSAGLFFAVHERHQEAVVWYSAMNELLLAVFGLGALLCWILAVRDRRWHVLGVVLFCLAILSKESAIVFLPLLLLVKNYRDWTLWPYIIVCLAAGLSIIESRTNSFRFSDGSFSLTAPFWITLPLSTFRLYWVWGVMSVCAGLWKKLPVKPVFQSFIWVLLALAPYSFLTYSLTIPSRQLYLASIGVALIVGAVVAHLERYFSKRWIVLFLFIVGAHNCAILWTKRRDQFLARSAPTEQLISIARTTKGPIMLHCFPQPRIVAEETLRLVVPEAFSRLRWSGDEQRCQ